jgi:hypothetical protein
MVCWRHGGQRVTVLAFPAIEPHRERCEHEHIRCIVSGRGSGESAREHLLLPFEGDIVPSIILSKAFLLAEDTKITDPTITRQIGRT